MTTPGAPSGGGATIPITTCFRYAHGFGDLAPHFAGLERGEALATRCGRCEAVWFAPRMVCRCGHRALGWVRLPGTGTIVSATEGEARIPLTDRRLLGRLREGTEAQVGRRVRLGVDPAPRAHPVQAALFLPLAD